MEMNTYLIGSNKHSMDTHRRMSCLSSLTIVASRRRVQQLVGVVACLVISSLISSLVISEWISSPSSPSPSQLVAQSVIYLLLSGSIVGDLTSPRGRVSIATIDFITKIILLYLLNYLNSCNLFIKQIGSNQVENKYLTHQNISPKIFNIFVLKIDF